MQQKYLICNSHQERVEFISRDINSNELIGLCMRCLSMLQGGPFEQIDNVLMNIENAKFKMVNHIKEQQNQNIQTMSKLIDILNKFKISQAKKIEQLINFLVFEMDNIKKKCDDSMEKIKEYNASIDVENLINLFSTLQNECSLDTTQSQLQTKLIQIEQPQFLFDTYKILQELSKPICLDISNPIYQSLKKNYKCPKHNEIMIGVDLGYDYMQQDDVICLFCINTARFNFSLTTPAEAEQIWKDYNENSKNCCQSFQNFIQNIALQTIDQILEKYLKTQQKLQTVLSILDKQKNSKLQRLYETIQQHQIYSIDYTSINHLQRLKNISRIQRDQWENFKLKLSSLQNINSQNIISNLQSFNQLVNSISNFFMPPVEQRKIEYQILSQINQHERCFAIAANSEGNLLAVSCENKIKLFEFKSGVLQYFQTLNGHSGWVFCLQFMKHQTKFVSASSDGIIKIWAQQQRNCWRVIATLQGHTDAIFSIQITKNGDQIISAGKDKSIIFWTKTDQDWDISQMFFEHQAVVYSLSLNESESKLISCGDGSLICILEQVEKNQWTIFQQLKQACGCRIGFITNDIFSLQPPSAELRIFSYDNKEKQFVLTATLEVQNNTRFEYDNFLFPQKFIRSKQVLISKHKNFLNIIRRDINNGEFLIEQFLDFIQPDHFGTITEDGEYIISWDSESKEIQVRKYTEIRNHQIKQ